MTEPTWWVVQTDMGKVIFHGSDKERADRVAAIHSRDAEPLYPASAIQALQERVEDLEGHVKREARLSTCMAEDRNDADARVKELESLALGYVDELGNTIGIVCNRIACEEIISLPCNLSDGFLTCMVGDPRDSS